MPPSETYQKSFDEPPAVRVSGSAEVGTLVTPYISYGLPYTEACVKHVTQTFKASRVYIIASGTLSRETDRLERLIAALKEKNVQIVGVKKGMRPHTPWSQIIEIAEEAKAAKADCFVTLGAGSLTDGAKIIVLVRIN
jgi:alcohol dehydrogenase class IV